MLVPVGPGDGGLGDVHLGEVIGAAGTERLVVGGAVGKGTGRGRGLGCGSGRRHDEVLLVRVRGSGED